MKNPNLNVILDDVIPVKDSEEDKCFSILLENTSAEHYVYYKIKSFHSYSEHFIVHPNPGRLLPRDPNSDKSGITKVLVRCRKVVDFRGKRLKFRILSDNKLVSSLSFNDLDFPFSEDHIFRFAFPSFLSKIQKQIISNWKLVLAILTLAALLSNSFIWTMFIAFLNLPFYFAQELVNVLIADPDVIEDETPNAHSIGSSREKSHVGIDFWTGFMHSMWMISSVLLFIGLLWGKKRLTFPWLVMAVFCNMTTVSTFFEIISSPKQNALYTWTTLGLCVATLTFGSISIYFFCRAVNNQDEN